MSLTGLETHNLNVFIALFEDKKVQQALAFTLSSQSKQ